MVIRYQKKNGSIKCAMNQNKPHFPSPVMSSSMQPTIIVNAEATFKKSDWIGVNKKYHDVPPEVSNARNAVLQVPELQSKHLFPSEGLPVTKLLEFKLPKIMKSIIGIKTKVWFSTDPLITSDVQGFANP